MTPITWPSRSADELEVDDRLSHQVSFLVPPSGG